MQSPDPVRVRTPRVTWLAASVALVVALIAVVALRAAAGAAGSTPRVSPSPPASAAGRGAVGEAPFQGWTLIYGHRALSPAQVAVLQRLTSARLVGVRGGELAVRSGDPRFPLVAVQTMTADPELYARAAGDPELARGMRQGVVLSTTGARLRRARLGQWLVLTGGRRERVSLVVPDALLGGYEMATTRWSIPGPVGTTYVLAPPHPADQAWRREIQRALPGVELRLVTRPANGMMSAADTVPTQSQMKTMFGEFAMVRRADGSLDVADTWERTWIRRARLPQLGVVACNERVLTALRNAMVEVTRRGLGSLVNTEDFRRQGGCWNPRVVRFGSSLSAHSWGAAVDINVAVNPLGAAPVQDPRLVAIMERHGFAWGGRWLRPDGAHFQWVGPQT